VGVLGLRLQLCVYNIEGVCDSVRLTLGVSVTCVCVCVCV
jgi:hypothetical protein